ncbi:MAG: esterase family protein [Thermoleophilia bacterium]|nr:esterase family protein [Thermoleophilia bacterium]
MAVRARAPVVGTDTIEFSYVDPTRTLTRVALAHELRRPRIVPFERGESRGRWTLEFTLRDADRMEYLLALTRPSGETALVADPANPSRAPGPFGEKSVVELPGYVEPDWIWDEDSPPGEVAPLTLESRRLGATVNGLLWSPADSDPAEPLPLVIAHDGPEYAEYSQLVRLLDHLVSFGDVPPLRAALLQPVQRDETYSASARYARALAGELVALLRAAAPTGDSLPVVMGASLGALAALHTHWRHPHVFGGLFLQSGSFFRERFDKHEASFRRFGRITRFVGQVLAGRAAPPAVPVTITCGAAEENLFNNRAVAAALRQQGWDVRLAEHRDAHNWVSWRDTFDPHLGQLILRAWT